MMAASASGHDSSASQHSEVWRRQVLRAGLFALLTALLMGVLLTVSLVPRPHQFREGEVSAVDVRSPRQLTFVSQIETRQARERAAMTVPVQMVMNPDLVFEQRRLLNALLENVSDLRAHPDLSFDERHHQLLRLVEPPLSTETATTLLGMEESRWLAIAAESQRLLQDVLKEQIPPARVEDVRLGLPVRAGDHLSEAERSLAVELASRFVVANLEPDEEATERLRTAAAEGVAPVEQTVEQGEMVLREGQVVSAIHLEKLAALGLADPTPDWRALAAATLLAFVAVGCVAGYIYTFHPELLGRERRLLMISLLMVATIVAAKIILTNRPLWAYVFPLPGIAMLVATLLSARLALVVSTLLAVLVGYVSGGSLEVTAMLAAASAVGAIGVWRRERLHSFFAVGVLVGITQLAVVTAFHLASRSEDYSHLLLLGAESLINGQLSAILAVGLTYITGRLFGITTTLQLLELANPTQPLLRRLLLEAPGTYHHSIMVGNLGERAAEEVGADPLLVRVGAYYHDIGKLRRPYCFIENQAGATNVHDMLDPRQSAEIIAAHVTDGEELARRYGLPSRVSELIPQHHGTRLVSFFYQKASETSPELVERSPFTYPGPKPQSKEGAILMLADSVEAASRASGDKSPEAIASLVEQIVMQRLAEGQLDECDLSLRDLTRIKQAFCTLLSGIYHPRIEYPERPPKPTQVAS